MAVTTVKGQKTIEEIINSSKAASPNSTSTRKIGDLGKDQFISLLVTQLQNQDPTNPVSDQDFASQMAQFSALEQMQNLNASFSANKAFVLIGKYATGTVKDENGTKSLIEGVVESVKMKSGNAYVIIGDTEVAVDDLTDIREGGDSKADIAKYSELIGKTINGNVFSTDGEGKLKLNGIVDGIEKGSGGIYAQISNVITQISDSTIKNNSTDPNYITDYFNNNVGNRLELEIVDADTGAKAKVDAILEDYSIANTGEIIGNLKAVNIPINNINKIEITDDES